MAKRLFLGALTLMCILLVVFSFIGCSANLSKEDKNGQAPTYNTNNNDTAFGSDTKDPVSSKTASTTDKNNALSGRKVIFTAALVIESTQYLKSIETLEKMIVEFSGYVQDSNVETSTSYNSSKILRNATYTIRIPSDKLTAFLSKAGNIGNIITNSSKGEDVTDQFFDTKAHLDALKIQEDRLLEILKKATVLKDIIDLEDRISQVRYEIEQLTGSLKQLTSRVELSTVTVNINEVDTITKPKPVGFWAQVSQTFSSSVKALVSTLRVIALVIVAISPFLVVFGFILLIVYLIYRHFNKKIKHAAQIENTESTTQEK